MAREKRLCENKKSTALRVILRKVEQHIAKENKMIRVGRRWLLKLVP
jgi:hypothetical protein